ncbi:MAG TPA: methyltransferase domain-containing protein [Geobacteraceae bacterium]
MIDRRKVRDAFGRQAHEYDAHAAVQKRVIGRFMKILEAEGRAPRRLLDVGAGTGMLLGSLRHLYGDAFAVGIDLALGMNQAARQNLQTDGRCQVMTADAERLPFAAESFDLVLSTSTFQWLTTLDAAFGEAFRVLAPGGLFFFSLFGGQTLHELRSSYRRALVAAGCPEDNRSHTFFSENDVTAALERAGLKNCRTLSEQDIDLHADVPFLLRTLKRIGAGSASPHTLRGLAGKRVMLEMMDGYRREYGKQSGIPATYEIIYGMGEKAC